MSNVRPHEAASGEEQRYVSVGGPSRIAVFLTVATTQGRLVAEQAKSSARGWLSGVGCSGWLAWPAVGLPSGKSRGSNEPLRSTSAVHFYTAYPWSKAMKSPRVISDPEILGGTPVFVGTRVPVRILFEHLEAGDSLAVFLENFNR